MLLQGGFDDVLGVSRSDGVGYYGWGFHVLLWFYMDLLCACRQGCLNDILHHFLYLGRGVLDFLCYRILFIVYCFFSNECLEVGLCFLVLIFVAPCLVGCCLLPFFANLCPLRSCLYISLIDVGGCHGVFIISLFAERLLSWMLL